MPYNVSSVSSCKEGDVATPLIDNFSRRITYLRLSVTDRCDLRCRYCCPESGIPLVPHDQILSYEEFERLVTIFASLGVSKVRLTGGEPFARRGLLDFVRRLKAIQGVEHLFLTTNGVQAGKYLDTLVEAGVDGINLSLDTLDAARYKSITRRDRLADVLHTLHGAIQRNIPIKVNSVVTDDTMDEELVALVGLSVDNPITVRFIEQMPFSGADRIVQHDNGSLLERLGTLLPPMTEVKASAPSTSRVFTLAGHTGRVGIIEGNSRHFCKTCNKVRVTATGMLKTCLYDNGSLDLRHLLRSGSDDSEIAAKIIDSVQNSSADGHAAETASRRVSEPCMAGIGG